MGSASSKNVSDITTKAISKIATDIITKTELTDNNSEIISVSNVTGDINIIGNTFTQTASLNMKSLMTAMTSQSAQQSLTQELSQTAKSLVKGINLLSFSNSTNEITDYLEAVIKIVTNIKLECGSTISNNQSIIVDRIKGDVLIKNNIFTQVSKIFSNCMSDTVSKTDAVQKLQQAIDQSAVSETKGFSLWVILAIVLSIFIGVPVVALQVKFIFPIILIASIIVFILYFVSTKTLMKSTEFSKLIKYNNNCDSTPYENKNTTKTKLVISQQCLDDKKCKAFDYIGQNVNNTNGNVIPATSTNYIFYSSIDNNIACTSIEQDKSTITRSPIVNYGNYEPSDMSSDYYINLSTGDLLKLEDGIWLLQENIYTTLGINPTLTLSISGDGEKDDIIIDIDDINLSFTNNITSSHLGDIKLSKVPDIKDNTNTSGFKIKQKNNVFLYISIPLFIVGIIGTIYIISSSKKNK